MNKVSKEISRNPELQSRFLVLKALTDTSVKMLPTEKLTILAKRYEISANNRALAGDLLCGVIKRQLTIDNLINKIAGRNTKRIERDLLIILRLGIYQLLFEEGIPDFAAIDTSCKLAGIFARKKQIGFVNAVLRTIQRAIVESNLKLKDKYSESERDNREDEKYILPIDTRKGIRFSREILPDSKTNIAKYLSLAYSYPRWLIQRWLGRWDCNTLTRILSAGNARAAIMLRPNVAKLKMHAAEQLANILESEGCNVKVLQEHQFVQLLSGPAITTLKAYKNGFFQVQDPTSAMLVKNLKLNKGMKILDLCAGLGTKTTQIAEMANDNVEVFASDKDENKLKSLMRNAKRLALKSIREISLAELQQLKYHGYFDIVILDVPCTNSGVFDRRPEARWRIKQESFQLFGKASIDLLDFARELVRPNGQIGFSTCSIDREENEYVIEQFSQQNDFTVRKQELILPVYDEASSRTIFSGGYYSVLSKSN